MKQKKFLSLFLILSMVITIFSFSKTNSFAVETKRLSGDDRYYTSAYIALDKFKRANSIIIASGETFPDALVSGTIAIPLNAPILLVQKNNIPKIIRQTISDLGCKNIYVIGGKNSVSDSVFNELSKKYSTFRIAGKDRYETSKEVKKLKERLFGFNSQTGVTGQVIGNLYHEALCASVVMSPKNHFLTLTDKLDASTDYAFGNRPRANNLHGTPYKIWFDGNDRYTVAAQCANQCADRIINEYHYDITTLYLVSGEKIPDALCASTYTNDNNSLLMLTPKKNVHKFVYELLNTYKIDKVIIIGGTDTVTLNIDETLDNYNIYSH